MAQHHAPTPDDFAAERALWIRVAEAAQAVTVGCEDQGEDFLLPSHLMAALSLALDESPLSSKQKAAK